MLQQLNALLPVQLPLSSRWCNAFWLDSIGIPPEDWTDAERTKWYHDKTLSFLPGKYMDLKSSISEWVERSMDAQFPVKVYKWGDWRSVEAHVQ